MVEMSPAGLREGGREGGREEGAYTVGLHQSRMTCKDQPNGSNMTDRRGDLLEPCESHERMPPTNKPYTLNPKT